MKDLFESDAVFGYVVIILPLTLFYIYSIISEKRGK